MTNASQDTKKLPIAGTIPIMVRIGVGQIAWIDRWIADNGPPYVTRPEAIRRLVQKGLQNDR